MQGQERAWKLLMGTDILLFGDLKEEEGAHSKTRRISDRLQPLKAGRWSDVWNMVGGRPEASDSLTTETERTAKRVAQLLEVHELSRAATAAWGTVAGRDASQIAVKFNNSQEKAALPRARHPPPADLPP